LSYTIDLNPKHVQDTCVLNYDDLRLPHLGEILKKWVNLKRLKINFAPISPVSVDEQLAEDSLSTIMKCTNLTHIELRFISELTDKDKYIREFDADQKLKVRSYMSLLIKVFAKYGEKLQSFGYFNDYGCHNVIQRDLVKIINCFPNLINLACEGFSTDKKECMKPTPFIKLNQLKTVFLCYFGPKYGCEGWGFLQSLVESANNLEKLHLQCSTDTVKCFDHLLKYPESLKEISFFMDGSIQGLLLTFHSLVNKIQPRVFLIKFLKKEMFDEDEPPECDLLRKHVFKSLCNSSITCGDAESKHMSDFECLNI